MFWDKEKIVTVFEIPEAIEGDPYIRNPKEEDKSIKTYHTDRETGKFITLWEEKLAYPYKTKIKSSLTVTTNKRSLSLPMFLDFDERTNEECFVWNGQNIPKIIWSILGISKHSPEGLTASKWHDILLYKKEKYLNLLRSAYPEMTVGEYRRLTSLIFRQLLKNKGVGTIKANVMAGAVAGWQFVSPQWWGVK